jgi:hypothetical protein
LLDGIRNSKLFFNFLFFLDEFDTKAWGKSKRMYYDADEGDYSDEEVAKEEEAEATKLQKERLSKMSEMDFMEDDFEQEEDDSFGARAGKSSGKGKKASSSDASKVCS